MMSYKRGDVVLVVFPNSDRMSGKKRPALIIQSTQLQAGLSQQVIAMITSNMARSGHASRVVFRRSTPDGQAMGILMDSIVMTDNLATVKESTIERKIGSLNDMKLIDDALRHTLGL